MKKSYIFLITSLLLIGGTAYFLSTESENEFIKEAEKELEIISNSKDSTFSLAEEILEDVSEQKEIEAAKMAELDKMVKKRQITIEQQVSELKSLVYQSNKMKELAESEKKKAMTVEKQARKQQMLAEEQRLKMGSVLDSISFENKKISDLNQKLTKEIESLKKEISKLETFIFENTKKPYGEEGSNGESNKKKKRRGEY